MNMGHRTRHMVDVLFVLGLFAVFALSALLLVTFGAKIYQNTVNKMDSNYNMRTAYSYITEKVRQSDCQDSISLGKIGNDSAFIITNEINQTYYETYIYHHDGQLKELLIKKGAEIDATAGQNILSIRSFEVEKINSSLYSFSVNDANNKLIQFYVDLKSS